MKLAGEGKTCSFCGEPWSQERRFAGGDRAIHPARPGVGDVGDHAAGGRIHDREGRPRGRFEAAADE